MEVLIWLPFCFIISQRMKEQKEIGEQLEDENRELNKRILKLEKQLAERSRKPLSVCIGSSESSIEELRIQIKHEVQFHLIQCMKNMTKLL
jgi:hypothetical protein